MVSQWRPPDPVLSKRKTLKLLAKSVNFPRWLHAMNFDELKAVVRLAEDERRRRRRNSKTGMLRYATRSLNFVAANYARNPRGWLQALNNYTLASLILTGREALR